MPNCPPRNTSKVIEPVQTGVSRQGTKRIIPKNRPNTQTTNDFQVKSNVEEPRPSMSKTFGSRFPKQDDVPKIDDSKEEDPLPIVSAKRSSSVSVKKNDEEEEPHEYVPDTHQIDKPRRRDLSRPQTSEDKSGQSNQPNAFTAEYFYKPSNSKPNTAEAEKINPFPSALRKNDDKINENKLGFQFPQPQGQQQFPPNTVINPLSQFVATQPQNPQSIPTQSTATISNQAASHLNSWGLILQSLLMK